VTGPSWASVDVTLTAMMAENALSVDMIRAGYRRFPEKLVNRSTTTPLAMPGFPAKRSWPQQVK
jgi:hypothetical protein